MAGAVGSSSMAGMVMVLVTFGHRFGSACELVEYGRNENQNAG